MSSNLLKGGWVQFQIDDTRVIDSNAILESRSHNGGGGRALAPGPEEEEAGLEAGSSEGFQSGLIAEELDGSLLDADGSGAVIKAALDEAGEEAAPPEPVYDGPSPEELIAQAEEEIGRMKEEAAAEIEEARRNAVDQGYQEGFQQGMSQGYNDGISQAETETAAVKARLEEEYDKRIQEAEPEMVRCLTNIYEHVFHVELAQRQDLILQLLENCMQQAEGSRDYIIHVSSEDHACVSGQKERLLEAVGKDDSTLEIIADITLKKNECMIETDGGVYDCGLDGQLQALSTELRLLSYEDGTDGT